MIRVFLIMFLLCNLSANSKKVLRVAIYEYPPISYKSESYKGYCLEIIKAVFNKAGHEVDFVFSSPARALENTSSKKSDAICTINKDLANLYKLSTAIIPNAKVDIKAWVRKNSNFKFKGISSLKNQRVITVKDYNYNSTNPQLQNYLTTNPDGNITTVSGRLAIARALKMIKQNRADILFLDKEHVEYYLRKQNNLDNFKTAGSLGIPIKSYFAISKTHPQKKILLETFNINYQKLLDEGQIQKTLKKYKVDWR